MTIPIYNPGQFEVVYPLIEASGKTPQWLILGGPANGNEAQTAIKKWPNLNIIGFEPLYDMVRWQLDNGWPREQPLLPLGLSSSLGVHDFHLGTAANPRDASFEIVHHGSMVPRLTTTVDALDEAYNFKDAIIWLDIEGWELHALKGTSRLFDRGDVLLVNVEITDSRPLLAYSIQEFMEEKNFKLAHSWNVQPGLVHDRIYVPKTKEL